MLGQYLAPGERGTLHRRKDLSCGFVFRFGLNKVFKLEFGSKVLFGYQLCKYICVYECDKRGSKRRRGNAVQFSAYLVFPYPKILFVN